MSSVEILQQLGKALTFSLLWETCHSPKVLGNILGLLKKRKKETDRKGLQTSKKKQGQVAEPAHLDLISQIPLLFPLVCLQAWSSPSRCPVLVSFVCAGWE